MSTQTQEVLPSRIIIVRRDETVLVPPRVGATMADCAGCQWNCSKTNGGCYLGKR